MSVKTHPPREVVTRVGVSEAGKVVREPASRREWSFERMLQGERVPVSPQDVSTRNGLATSKAGASRGYEWHPTK